MKVLSDLTINAFLLNMKLFFRDLTINTLFFNRKLLFYDLLINAFSV